MHRASAGRVMTDRSSKNRDDGTRTLRRVPGVKPVRAGIGVNAAINDASDEDDFDSHLEDWDEYDAREARRRHGREEARLEPRFEFRPARKPKADKPAAKPAAKPLAKPKPKPKPVTRTTPRSSAPGRSDVSARPLRGGTTRSKKLLGFLFYWLLVAAIWSAILFGCVFIYFGLHLPETTSLYDIEHTPSVSILAADGQALSHRGDLLGGNVTLADLPPYVPKAVIATEDQRFYYHFGVDPIGLVRAMALNFRARAIVQGGSTITQQLAKNVFLRPDRTFARKIEEMILAIWLEMRLSKEEILTLYLNRVYFGGGAYGIEAASERYFKKPARALSLPEAAMLAGLLKAPSRYAPSNDINLARGRARIVLQNMVNAGYITSDDARLANINPASMEGYSATGSINYFVDWIADALPDYAGRVDSDVVVQTTIDPYLQREAEAVLQKALAAHGAELNITQAALVALSPDGAVRAMVGGRSYVQSQFNRAVQAARQPGSAFKPFVYLAAMEQGLTPETVRIDRPVTYGAWSPENYGNKYEGPVSLRTALMKSINTVAVQLTSEVGVRQVIRVAQRLGIQGDLPNNLSLALGTGDVNLLELTAAYATFANGGNGVIPHGIEGVVSQKGEMLYHREGSGLGRIVDEHVVGEMNDMMKAVISSGTGRKAALDGREAAGKTGTTQDFRDAWFIGYTADLVVGVWLGNDDGAPMKKVTGGSLPAEIWHDFMAGTQANVRVASLPGGYDPSQATSPIPAQDEFRSTDGEAPMSAAQEPRSWEAPGFFERLFGAGNDGDTDRAGPLPRHQDSGR